VKLTEGGDVGDEQREEVEPREATSSRRQLLQKAAAAGAVAWAAPVILSSGSASATTGNCGGSPPPCKTYRNKYHDNSGSAYDADQYGYWLDGVDRPHDGSLISHSTGSGTTSTVSFGDRVKWTRYAIFYGDSFTAPPKYTKVPGFEVSNSAYGTCDGSKSNLLSVQWPADRQQKDYVLVIEFTLAPKCKKEWVKKCVKYHPNGNCKEYDWVQEWAWGF
jgi:hypothetical protein